MLQVQFLKEFTDKIIKEEEIMEIWECGREEESFQLAKKLGEKAKKGEIYCLEGELGTGKTVFAKGFAKGLEIEEIVDSPTFTIVKEYQGREKLYHFDVYRIEDVEELQEIGFSEMISGDAVCLIEWASRIEEEIPENAKWITIEKDLEKGFDYRRICMGDRK